MTAAMTTHFACTCGHTGSYAWADITTVTDGALPDAKHLATCKRVVLTSTTADAAVRLAGAVRG